MSAYWNGAATYYRGIIRALNVHGHRITFYEPDVYNRQQHRDIPDPSWASVVVYPSEGEQEVWRALESARGADMIVKTSNVGAFDALLEAAVFEISEPHTPVVFWDVDAPATLDRLQLNPADPFRLLIPHYDLVLTYGGGDPVVNAYRALGARECVPIYNALDPETHHPTAPDQRFEADLCLLANRLPDREARVEEFFLRAATEWPEGRFLLGGSGWHDKPTPKNVRYVGHVYTRDHNAFNCTPLAVLNVNRESMARYGFSPPTRVFEACGAGACLITDHWRGIELFLEPGREVLVAQDGREVAEHLRALRPERARAIGKAALRRVLTEHTYTHRVAQLEALLEGKQRPAVSSRSRSAQALVAERLDIVIFGLSITSSWGNGHATTFRGLVRELSARGHDVLFLERDVPWYAEHRDLPQPPYGRTYLYSGLNDLRERFATEVRNADLVMVGSFVPDGMVVGEWVTNTTRGVTAFYDIDTPVTLARLQRGDTDYLSASLIPRYDLYLSFTGGPTLDRIEREYGSPMVRPLYCSAERAPL